MRAVPLRAGPPRGGVRADRHDPRGARRRTNPAIEQRFSNESRSRQS